MVNTSKREVFRGFPSIQIAPISDVSNHVRAVDRRSTGLQTIEICVDRRGFDFGRWGGYTLQAESSFWRPRSCLFTHPERRNRPEHRDHPSGNRHRSQPHYPGRSSILSSLGGSRFALIRVLTVVMLRASPQQPRSDWIFRIRAVEHRFAVLFCLIVVKKLLLTGATPTPRIDLLPTPCPSTSRHDRRKLKIPKKSKSPFLKSHCIG